MGRAITRSISRVLLKAGIERLARSSIRIKHNRGLDALALRIRNVQIPRRMSVQPPQAAPIVSKRLSLQPASKPYSGRSNLTSSGVAASTSRGTLQASSNAIWSTSHALQSENMESLSYSSNSSPLDNETDNVPSTSAFPGHTQKVGRKSYFTTAQMNRYVQSFVTRGQGENDDGRGIINQTITSENATAPLGENVSTPSLDEQSVQGENDDGLGINNQTITSENATTPTLYLLDGLFGAEGGGSEQTDASGENVSPPALNEQSVQDDHGDGGGNQPIADQSLGENGDGRNVSDQTISSGAKTPTYYGLFGAEGGGSKQTDASGENVSPPALNEQSVQAGDGSGDQPIADQNLGVIPQRIVSRRFSVSLSTPPMSRMNRYSLKPIPEVDCENEN